MRRLLFALVLSFAAPLAAQLTSTFIRLKKEAYERPDPAEAEFALNSDAGGG